MVWNGENICIVESTNGDLVRFFGVTGTRPKDQCFLVNQDTYRQCRESENVVRPLGIRDGSKRPLSLEEILNSKNNILGHYMLKNGLLDKYRAEKGSPQASNAPSEELMIMFLLICSYCIIGGTCNLEELKNFTIWLHNELKVSCYIRC